MAIKRDDGEHRVSKKLRRSNWNKGHVQEDIDPAIDSNDNSGDDGVMCEEVEASLTRVPINLENYSKARIPNALKSFKVGDVG